MDNNEQRPKRPRITHSVMPPAQSNREYRREGRYDRADNPGYHSDHYSGKPYEPNRPNRPYQPRYGSAQADNTEGRRDGYAPRSNEGTYRRQEAEGYRPRENSHYQPRRGNYDYNRPERPRFNGPATYSEQPYRQSRQLRNDSYGGDHPAFGGNPRRPAGRNQYPQQPRPGKTFTPRPKPVVYEMPIPDPDEKIRLNKFMANSGICSRREADQYILDGMVKVNGQVVTELGTKISHNDNVEFDEKLVALENKTYILLNKPKDCVTTSDDPHGRLTVLDLVKGACKERIYPVGRLDRNTTGVLLLTNDGDLASKLTHPKFVKKKIYHVWTDRDIAEEDMQKIADGIELEDGPIHADAISYATEKDRNQAGIEIHSGQNRIVRRIFEKLGYHVTKLDRVYFAGLTKKNLPRGRWRYLTQAEVNLLKKGAFE